MPATIDTISPGRGRAGDSVTIVGSGFDLGGANVVTFDGVPVPGAQVSVVDAETLTAVVPVGVAVNRHLVVQVTNQADNTLTGWWWFSQLSTAALLATDRLPGKIPGRLEAGIPGLLDPGDVNVRLVQALDFERMAARLELLPIDLVAGGAGSVAMTSSLGMRVVSPGPDGAVLTRDDANGGEFRARELGIMWWGKRVPAATVTELEMVAQAIAGEAGQFGEGHPAFVAGRLAQLALFIAPTSTGTASRIVQVRVLVNGIEVLDTDDLDFGQQPSENRDDVWTIAPWLNLTAGDEVRIVIRKNNTFDTLDVFATGVIL